MRMHRAFAIRRNGVKTNLLRLTDVFLALVIPAAAGYLVMSKSWLSAVLFGAGAGATYWLQSRYYGHRRLFWLMPLLPFVSVTAGVFGRFGVQAFSESAARFAIGTMLVCSGVSVAGVLQGKAKGWSYSTLMSKTTSYMSVFIGLALGFGLGYVVSTNGVHLAQIVLLSYILFFVGVFMAHVSLVLGEMMPFYAVIFVGLCAGVWKVDTDMGITLTAVVLVPVIAFLVKLRSVARRDVQLREEIVADINRVQKAAEERKKQKEAFGIREE